MGRVYEHSGDLTFRHGQDPWPLIERAERAMRGQVPSWGSGDFDVYVLVHDSGGREKWATAAEAKAALSGTRYELESLSVYAREAGPDDRFASAGVINLDAPPTTPKRFMVTARGPEEAPVVGLVRVVLDEARVASGAALAPATPTPAPGAPPLPSPTPTPRSRPIQAFMNHPWTVGVGTAVVSAGVIALITRWLS